MRLFCDCKTDEEKSNFFLSGKAVETGVIAPAISNDVAMAYHRCAQFKKEVDTLHARLEALEQQESIAYQCKAPQVNSLGELIGYIDWPAGKVPDCWPTEEMTTAFARVFNTRDQYGTFPQAFRAALAVAPEAKL